METLKDFYYKNQYVIIILFVIVLIYYTNNNKESFDNNAKLISQLKQQNFIQNAIKYEKEKKDKEQELQKINKQKELQEKLYLSKQNNKSQLTKLQQIGLEESIRKIKDKISVTTNPFEQKALQTQLLNLQQAYTLKNSSINF